MIPTPFFKITLSNGDHFEFGIRDVEPNNNGVGFVYTYANTNSLYTRRTRHNVRHNVKLTENTIGAAIKSMTSDTRITFESSFQWDSLETFLATQIGDHPDLSIQVYKEE